MYWLVSRGNIELVPQASLESLLNALPSGSVVDIDFHAGFKLPDHNAFRMLGWVENPVIRVYIIDSSPRYDESDSSPNVLRGLVNGQTVQAKLYNRPSNEFVLGKRLMPGDLRLNSSPLEGSLIQNLISLYGSIGLAEKAEELFGHIGEHWKLQGKRQDELDLGTLLIITIKSFLCAPLSRYAPQEAGNVFLSESAGPFAINRYDAATGSTGHMGAHQGSRIVLQPIHAVSRTNNAETLKISQKNLPEDAYLVVPANPGSYFTA